MLNTCLRLLQRLPAALRFMVVGGCAAAVHFAVVLLCVEGFGFAPLLANVLGFLVAFNVSYFGHRLLTFAVQASTGSADAQPISQLPQLPPHTHALPRFFAIACASFVVNEVLFYFALNTLHWPYQPALFAVLLLVAVGTYAASKAWAFAHQPSEPV